MFMTVQYMKCIDKIMLINSPYSFYLNLQENTTIEETISTIIAIDKYELINIKKASAKYKIMSKETYK